MKNFTRAIALALVALGVLSAGQLTVAVDADASMSVRKFAGEMRTEQKQLLVALPDGTRVIFASIGVRVMPLLDMPLSPAARMEARRRIDALRYSESHTDLAGALDQARLALSRVPERRVVILFTDGDQRVPYDHPNNARSFPAALTQAASADPSLELFVRIYGGARIEFGAAGRPNIHLIDDTPDWRTVLGIQLPIPSIPALPNPDPRPWYGGAVATFAAMAALGVLALRRFRRIRQAQAETELTDSLEPTQPQLPPPPRIVVRYIVEREVGGESLSLGEGSMSEAIVGDSPLANLYLSAAEGASIRLAVQNETLQLENCGRVSIMVGRRTITPGARLALPCTRVELRLGTEILAVGPTTVALTQTEGSDFNA